MTVSRLPESVRTYGAGVEVLSAETRTRRQQFRLQDALNLTSGVISTSPAGQEGQIGTLIIRGLATKYNNVQIDGVRVTDSLSTDTVGNLFGNTLLGGNEQIEVARSGQQALQGNGVFGGGVNICLLYTSPSPRDQRGSRMPSSA